MSMIRAFVKRPDSGWYATNISNNLESLQRLVGGYIETVTIARDAILICNEEGRIQDLPYCCQIGGTPFFGTVALVGCDGEEFADLPSTLHLKEWKAIAEVKRRTRYAYEIRVNGKRWVQGTKIDPMKAAQEAAKNGWAKGKKLEIVEVKNGALCPF